MAKHVKGTKQGSKVSKGERRSSVPQRKQGAITVGGSTNNAMREAFLSTSFPDAVRFSRLGACVIKAAQNEPKRTVDQAKGWSTKLSFRTFKALQEQGVLA